MAGGKLKNILPGSLIYYFGSAEDHEYPVLCSSSQVPNHALYLEVNLKDQGYRSWPNGPNIFRKARKK